jgi:hypothetical protein
MVERSGRKCPDLDLVICRVVRIAGKREKFIKKLPTGKLTRRDEKRIWSFRPMRSIHGDAHVDVVPFWSAWAILWPMKSAGGHQLPIVGRRGSANHVSPDSNHLRHQRDNQPFIHIQYAPTTLKDHVSQKKTLVVGRLDVHRVDLIRSPPRFS